MDIAIITAIIVAIPATITAMTALYIALKTSYQIHEVHMSLNSRFDEWMVMTKKASFAEGHKAASDEATHSLETLDSKPC